ASQQARIEVASFSGNARVSGTAGNLLASVAAGRSMTFAMQQAVTRTGCLVFKNNGFILQVDDSPEVLQLNGRGLAANVGNRVEVGGNRSTKAATIAPATAILDVTSVAQRSTGGCISSAATLNGQTSVPPDYKEAAVLAGAAAGAAAAGTVAAAGGLSTAATVGIVAAVAGGGAGAALAVSGSKKSTSQ
ncbi:MAG: hypothetical protein ABI995_06130, partial [Acidobacteriota bacterium]